MKFLLTLSHLAIAVFGAQADDSKPATSNVPRRRVSARSPGPSGHVPAEGSGSEERQGSTRRRR